jgi:hypothetical protein
MLYSDILQPRVMQRKGARRVRATKRASGAVFGLALGDALGARTEFLSLEEIALQFPPAGPTTLVGNPALVTDDTQMALDWRHYPLYRAA